MWWGGSEGGQGGSPPPDDPPVEQGDGSGEDAAVIRQELGDLKDQFEEQQALIGQLKDMLKKKEATLTVREKEVQDYSSRLARMKPRLGRRVNKSKQSSSGPSEHSGSGESLEAAGSSATAGGEPATSGASEGASALPSLSPSVEERLTPPLPGEEIVIPAIPAAEGRAIEEKKLSSSESSSRAKILLLRKQLQENRVKFQRQQKDDGKLAMEEMKHRIDRLRAEVEQRDDIIQSLQQEGKGSLQEEPTMQKLYQQIVYKDNTILELSQKVNHLESVIQDQQESLSEKDKVIEARTEAVSLIAKAQDEKGLKTLEELEDVRHQMKKMQENFISKEQEMTTEKEGLSKELKDKMKKINQLEDNGRRLENLRFEMSARNAELQEKIVALQSDTKSLREQSEAEREIYSEKESLLQELKQKLVKAEAHGHKKLKALEKQLRSIKQDGNAGEKIVELQNAIAELEEEKGNLQLKLVDFDDLKVTNEKLTLARSKLEDHVKQLNRDLDSQLSAITQLETEKIKLVEGINERENRIFDLESEVSGLKSNLEEITQAKVTLDLRLCEVEEQRDTAEKLRVELENQMTETGRAPVEKLMAEKGSLEVMLQSIQKERDEWEQKYLGQNDTVLECEKNTKSAMEEKDQKARECKRLMNILTDKENAIATLSIQIDKNDAVVTGLEGKIRLANAETEKVQLEVNSLNQNLQDHIQKLQAAQETIAEMEKRLSDAAGEIQSKDRELDSFKDNAESLNRSVNEKNITVQNLVGEVSSLQEEVRQKEKSINDHIIRLEELESQVNNRDTEIEKLCAAIANKEEQISLKSMEIESLKKDLVNSSKQLETTKSSLECELDALSAMLSDSKNQSESLQMDLEVKAREIENNQIIISKYEQEVCDKNQAIDELQKQCQDQLAKVSTMLSSTAEKEAMIAKLQSEIDEKIMEVENMQIEILTLEQKVLHQAEENNAVTVEKCRLEEELNENNLLSQNLKDTISEKMDLIGSLEASVRSLTNEIQTKASEAEKWQQEALEKSEHVNALTVQLESIHSNSGSKDTLIADLQTQISQKQDQISELSNQLHGMEQQLTESQQNTSQMQEQLTKTSNELEQTQDDSQRVKDELVKSLLQLEEMNLHYEQVTTLAAQFEGQLRIKSSSLEFAEKQMATQQESNDQELKTVHHDIDQLKSEVARLNAELSISREQVEASNVELSQQQEHIRKIEEDLENTKHLLKSSQQQFEITKQELDLKFHEVSQLQQSLSEHQLKNSALGEELNQAVYQQQQYQQQASSLQEELNQALNLKQQSDSEIASLSLTQQQRISQLEGELLAVNQARNQIQLESENSQTEMQRQFDEMRVSIDNLTSQISAKDAEVQSLLDQVSDLKKSEETLKSSIEELQGEKTQLLTKAQVLEVSSLDSRGIPPESNSEVTSLKEELMKALDQSRFLEEECDGLREDSRTLKQQLQDARQTITHLQTNLATQPQSDATAGSWDDWGEVDLGAPPSAPAEVPQQTSSLVSSLQKSLADKDEMLTMMQDQLKETLQEINTINEEKKVLEQQKHSTEAGASQQMEKWIEDKEELDRLRAEIEASSALQVTVEQEKERIVSLEQELTQKQQVIEELNQKLNQIQNVYQHPPLQEVMPTSSEANTAVISESTGKTEKAVVSLATQETNTDGSNLFTAAQWPQTGSEESAADWFNQQAIVTDTQVSPMQNLVDQVQDPVSWFDQPHISQEVQTAGQEAPVEQHYEHKQQEPYDEQQQQTLQQTSEVSQEERPLNIEELQYKLSWYEEQWSTWTAHYNQLQTSYQESEVRVAELSQQLQVLQSSTAMVVQDKEVSPELQSSAAADAQYKDVSLGGDDTAKVSKPTEDQVTPTAAVAHSEEIQTRLIDAETALEKLREENRLIQAEASQVAELRSEIESLQKAADNPTRLQDAEAEVNRLRGFETQVYELQSQVQALQHQCTAMQNKLCEAETEVGRLREVEALYGELQSCIQESETKREGSTSRVQELELMVQSAESEIARLRNEIEVLSQAGQTAELDREAAEVSVLSDEVVRLQNEVDRCQKEAGLFKDEVDKCQNESDLYKAEMARLENENQNMGDEMARARSDLQRMEQENSQLRSELEVFEGELDRTRSACEMYEADNNRVRGEYEAMAQAHQMTEAEKESLESEVQRITAQNMTLSADSEHLRDEIQRLTEVSTSAETETVRLQNEMERFKSLDLQYTNLETKYTELQAQVASMESADGAKVSESESQSLVVEEVDWSAEGQIEDEHLQRSSSVDLKYQEEIDNLKEKVIALEKEKNALYDEVQSAKLKSGKMLQKLKLTQSKNESLTKEIKKLKAKAGGFSDLDQALEEEWKAQVAKAELERDEFKQKLDEVENEKEHLLSQVDVLTAAQEQYLELKEDQDTTIKLLKSRNKEVEGQLQALEWRISELEEAVEQQQQPHENIQEPLIHPRTSPERLLGASVTSDGATSKELEALKVEISYLEKENKILKSENERLQTSLKEIEEVVESLSHENETFQSVIAGLKEAKTKAEGDTSNYKSIYIELHDEHELMKKEKEKINEELRELTYTHDTLKAAYNSLYTEYNDLRDVCDSHKHDVGILRGERDRLVEEINSLKNQLQALHEEEEEETIRALQEECSSLREQNNLLHEENTALEVKTDDAIEKASRLENTLEQNVEMQKLLQDELMKKSEEISFHTTTIEGQERQMTYLKAEMAAMKTKLSQQDQADESTLETNQELQARVEQLQDQNQQLQIQVEAAETSLAKLAGGSSGNNNEVFSPSAPSTTELEAALASLHLRDLRCQQLSLEITKLLEERDALQLKLSASLRQTQELSRELTLSHQLPAPVTPEPSLDQKLAELRELNDSLEQKALVSLQGSASAGMGRRITVGGLPSPPIFTPHTAPPTPTATRHADYTLTREAQGTSSTLIDWIMGKSTPRVLHV